VDEKLLTSFGLKKEEILILWFVLDKINLETSHKEHNSLIMNKYYNMGLNYMRVLNKPFDQWKVDTQHV